MTNELYRSSISLRLTSSIIPAASMISTIGMTPSFAWNKGESLSLPRSNGHSSYGIAASVFTAAEQPMG